MLDITLDVNGRQHTLAVDERSSLLDVLRNQLELTGSKKGCDHGQCGACTILLNGERINSCLTLAVMHEGDAITTIEGLGTADDLSALQQAFVAHDGYQCGYCTPGQICSATAMLDEARRGWPSAVSDRLDAGLDDDLANGRATLSREEIAERMSGNLCRCAAYPNIVDAITEVCATEVPRSSGEGQSSNEGQSPREGQGAHAGMQAAGSPGARS